MKFWPFGRRRDEAKAGLTIEQVIERWQIANAGAAGIAVGPENCMSSPTVAAIVTAITRRISSLPIEVVARKESNGRVTTERLPNHPVAKLLAKPNHWQDPVQFWQDAASFIARHGNFYAWKVRGQTGPIRELLPLHPGAVQVTQEVDWTVIYRVTLPGGQYREASPGDVMHARGPARDGLVGNSIVMDIREAIGLEIQAEKMGASVFGNSALASIIFRYAEGFAGHKTDEERAKFVEDFQNVYSRTGRFRAMLLPKGIEVDNTQGAENEKAQYTETRQHQRTVIAAAWQVPPHMVGDLSRGTFNNVEQQSLDFVGNVILPYVRMFEAAMDRALLTDDDRRAGIGVRFNLAGALRGDFKSRQEGLKIQREMGVISANEWRQAEGMNPLAEDDGGDIYWQKGPSGQGEADPPAGDNEEKPASDEPPAPGNDNEGAKDNAAA